MSPRKRPIRRVLASSAAFGTGADALAIYGAAYLLTRDAFVRLEEEGGGIRVTLKPKSGAPSAAVLVRALRAAYADQVFRWGLANNDREVRERLIARALRGPAGPGGTAAPGGLAPEQESEIAALVAEAESSGSPDPEGIRTPWSELRKQGGGR